MTDAYETWRNAAMTTTYTPLTDEQIEAMFLATTQHGPANCWTGTSGTLATMIRQLLREREYLLLQRIYDAWELDNDAADA